MLSLDGVTVTVCADISLRFQVSVEGEIKKGAEYGKDESGTSALIETVTTASVVALDRDTVYELPPEMASETEKEDIAGTTEPEFELITVKIPVVDGWSLLKAD